MTIATIALVTVLTIAAAFMLFLSTNASTTPKPNTPTNAYLSFRPNPIGIGQELLVNAWVTPAPPLVVDLGYPLPPGKTPMAGIPREGYMINITDPDGNVNTVGPMTSSEEGAIWFIYVPDQVGTWTIQFSWPGVELTGEPGAKVSYCSYLPSSTDEQTLVVQEDPIPSWPAAKLPTDEAWDWPVNPENREWVDIMGPWSTTSYNACRANYNPYAQAPNSAHVLWKFPTGQLSGLIGQPYGYLASYSISNSMMYPGIKTVMLGRGYSRTETLFRRLEYQAHHPL